MTLPQYLPFKEAIDFFKAKIQLPSSGYADIRQEQHSLAFVVAGAQTDALVGDFYNAMRQAKEKGTGYTAFQAEFDTIVARHKWAYKGTPGWRSKVIYDTNMTAAYNAGRWQQQWANRDAMPYLRYVHTSRENPRPHHKAWHGTILPITSPWWLTHYTPNGYGCKCRVDPLTSSQAEGEWTAAGKTGPDPEPEVIWEEVPIGKTGSNPRTVRTPVGVDPGFAYNPGKAYLEPHTVPPLAGYDAVVAKRATPWPSGVVRPILPTATKVPPSVKLPKDTPPEQAVEGFLDVFGATLDEGVTVMDAADTAIVVSKALFIAGGNKGADRFKWLAAPDKADRLENLNLLAMTLAQPDEVWWEWVQDNSPDGKAEGRWRLKRRYLRAFEVDGTGEYGIAIFEWSDKGWTGATTFTASAKTEEARLRYFEKMRSGRLVYKQK